MAGVAAELQDVPLRDAQVLELLPQGGGGALRDDAAEVVGHVRHRPLERQVGAVTGQQAHRVLAYGLVTHAVLLGRHHGVHLDLHQVLGQHEPGNLGHGHDRPDTAEQLGVGAADRVGIADVGHVVAGSHHVGKRGAHIGERLLDLAQDEERLAVRVVHGHRLAVAAGGAGAGHEDQIADAQGARVAVALLPGSAG